MPEFKANKPVNEIFSVLGFNTTYDEERTYGKSRIANNNYLTLLTGLIQYRLYSSKYSQRAFSVSLDSVTISFRRNKLILMH